VPRVKFDVVGDCCYNIFCFDIYSLEICISQRFLIPYLSLNGRLLPQLNDAFENDIVEIDWFDQMVFST